MNYKVIRKLRVERDIRQKQLITATKISQTFISEIENGHKDPSIATLKLIAKGLNMKLKDLIDQCYEENEK